MTNLVPLHLDKSTGNIVAGNFNSGSGTLNVTGFEFFQTVASNVWDIPHNTGTAAVMIQVFDEDGFGILPDEWQIVDTNNVQITFASTQTGKAILMLLKQ